MRLGKPGEAIEHFQEVLAIDPQDALARRNLRKALLLLGKPEEAIEHYKKILESDPRSAAAHCDWGIALLRLGKPEEAIEHCRKAVEIDPEFAGAHYYWGEALCQLGKPNKAIEQFEKAVAIHPQFAAAHNRWGKVLCELGKPEQAIPHYQAAMESDPGNPETPKNLAWLLATCPVDEIRDGAKAVELAEGLCEASQYRIPIMLDTLAAAYAEVGKFPEAVATVTQALDLVRPQQGSFAEGLRRRLELYKADKPYRERPEVEAETGRR